MTAITLDFMVIGDLPKISTPNITAESKGNALPLPAEQIKQIEQTNVTDTYIKALKDEMNVTKPKAFLAFNFVFLSISLLLITPYGLIPLLITTGILMRHLAHMTTLFLFEKQRNGSQK